MGNERQILDFIFDARTAPLKKGLASAEKMASKFGKALDDAFNIGETARSTKQSVSSVVESIREKGLKVSGLQKGLATLTAFAPGIGSLAKGLQPIVGGGLSLAFKGLNTALDDGVKRWKDNFIRMEEFRRSTGLSMEGVRDFSTEVVSVSNKYGQALDKVATTAIFLRSGMKGAQREVVALAGSLENFNDLTGTSSETTQKLAFMMTRRMGVAGEVMKRAMHGYRAIATDAGIATDEIVNLLSENENFIRSGGKKNAEMMTAQGAAIIASMREQGAEIEHVGELLNALGDPNSKLTKMFLTQGFSIKKLSGLFKSLLPLMDPDNPAVYEKALYDLSSQFDLSRQAAEAFAKANDNVNDRVEIFNKTVSNSSEVLDAALEKQAGPLKRWERTWNKTSGAVVTALDFYFGPKSKAYEIFDTFTSGVGIMLDTLLTFNFGKFKEAAKELTSIVSGALEGLDYLINGSPTGRSFSPRTDEEKAVHDRTEYNTRLQTMAAKNVASGAWTQEMADRYLQENLRGGVKSSIPTSAAPTTASSRKDPTAEATAELGNKTDQQTEILKQMRDEMRQERTMNQSRGDMSRFSAASAVAEGY